MGVGFDVGSWANAVIESGYTTSINTNAAVLGIVRPGAATTDGTCYGGANVNASFVAHVVINPAMVVQHIDSITGGETDLPAASADPQTVNYTITTIADLEQASHFASVGDSTAAPDPPAFAWQTRLSSTTNIEYKRARHIAASEMSAQIVGAWPASIDAPINLSATAGVEEIILSFDAVVGTDSHNIYWSLSPTVTTSDNVISTITTSYVHTGLTAGVTYYYAVTAVLGVSESVLSSEVSASPTSSGGGGGLSIVFINNGLFIMGA